MHWVRVGSPTHGDGGTPNLTVGRQQCIWMAVRACFRKGRQKELNCTSVAMGCDDDFGGCTKSLSY